jgi:stearoyl-CoA desaturase (delta-9 desaturase)
MKAVQNAPTRTEARSAATPRTEGRIAKATILVPAIAVAVAVAAAISGVARPALLELLMTAALCLVTQLGVTVGFHRLFTHRSFETARAIRVALGIAGSMAAQGPLLFWVSEHREHHQKSDSAGDPHSPHLEGEAALTGLRGFWHAHVGWMLDHASSAWQIYARDIFSDSLSLRISFIPCG